MFQYIDQFTCSDYLPTSFKSQAASTCEPIKALTRPQVEENNIIKVIKQVKVFEQTRQEEVYKSTKVSKLLDKLLYSTLKQSHLEQLNLVGSQPWQKSLLAKTSLISAIDPPSYSLFKIVKELSNSKRVLISTLKKEKSSDTTNSSQNSADKKEQYSSQTVNKSQAILTNLHRANKLSRSATLQSKVLLEIYNRQTDNNDHPVEWNPVVWFTDGNLVTASTRSKWSKTLRILVDKGLVCKQIESDRQFSSNSGNSPSLVSLTPAGRQYIKYL